MKIQGLVFLLLMATGAYTLAASTAPQCPEFDVAGNWSNTYGQFFKIDQKGCATVTLTRISQPGDTPNKFELAHPIVFQLDGNSASSLSSHSFGGISTLGGDGERLAKVTLDHQRIFTQLTHDTYSKELRMVSVAAQGDLPIPGLIKNSYNIFTYTYLGRITASTGYGVQLNSDGTQTIHRYPIDGLTLQTDKLALNDIKSSKGETIENSSAVVYGANLILNLVGQAITAQLVRVK